MSILLPTLGYLGDIPQLSILPYVLAVFMAVVITVDWAFSRRRPLLSSRRNIPQSLSVNCEHTVKIEITNNDRLAFHFDVEEHFPEDWSLLTDLHELEIEPGESLQLEYKIIPHQRGLARLSFTEFCTASILGYWQFSWLFENDSDVKVYPNFLAIQNMAGLNGNINLTQAGLKKFNLRGSGMDFRQLREYREGESLKQIDWRATSRFNKLISKEFQEEKNQHVMIMLDAGQRMRVHDDDMTYFDHALNSLILLSHSALKNGDSLSLQSFGSETRWLGQMKGVQSVSKILHHFYDLYPQKIASDYVKAAQDLLLKQPKRALILLVSCLRDEDFSDLLTAVKIVQKKHLFAVISISESIYETILSEPVDNFEQALMYSSAQVLNQSIERNFKRLKKQGVICVHAPATQLTSNVINTYLSVKKAGLL
ncbi:MAG: DUF58 domain-containing protein [Paraglaciecola sp.]|uniref:DUF58 domain-containing protein n=1 Tax=Paraglaciecola sp. TaxID=1920173 RepID=UPI003299EE9A